MTQFDVKGYLKKVSGLHHVIANDVCRDDIYRLRCRTCNALEAISAREFAHYLSSGWPKCCGQTKTLEKEPSAGAEQ